MYLVYAKYRARHYVVKMRSIPHMEAGNEGLRKLNEKFLLVLIIHKKIFQTELLYKQSQ
jgi:hypothetical protein